MVDKQAILLQLACAALQGGITPDEVFEQIDIEGDIWYIAQQIYPDDFHVLGEEEEIIKNDNSCYKY